jgi:hypothetical protein
MLNKSEIPNKMIFIFVKIKRKYNRNQAIYINQKKNLIKFLLKNKRKYLFNF